MKFALKSLVLASALAMAGAAQAEIANATLVAGEDECTGAFGYEMCNLQGGGSLAFSKALIGALNAAGAVTTGVEPAVVSVSRTAITAEAPITQLSGQFDSSTAIFTATRVKTAGGATMTTVADDFTTIGGSLKITNISVNLADKAIFADITGGNGVGTVKNQQIWNYGTITGDTAYKAVAGTIVSENTISGLTITGNAFNLFAQSLGLTDAGIAAMQQIKDYGVMTSRLSVDVTGGTTPPIPEPSTYMLMGLGLVGLAFASKRARRA